MYRLTTLTTALGLLAAPVLADVQGIWQTPKMDSGRYGHVEIAPCGNALCGTLVRGWDEQGREGDAETMPGLLGRQIVWDMKPDGANAWSDGKVWAPDRDRTYNAKMELEGDRLNVSGCVLVFCREQTWTRVK